MTVFLPYTPKIRAVVCFTVRPYSLDEVADDGDQHVLLAAREPDLSVAPLDGLLSQLLDQDSFRLLLTLF
jgi:hypothetical protein